MKKGAIVGAFKWNIEKVVSKGEYNYAVVKDHPNSIEFGYVLEHRVVVENHLKRLLNANEVVHHINGDKKDNRIENLEVLNAKTHAKLHGLLHGTKWCELKCPQCSKVFHREKHQTFLVKGGSFSACSRKCSGTFSRTIQLHGVTLEVERAISVNLVREYNKYSTDNTEETI